MQSPMLLSSTLLREADKADRVVVEGRAKCPETQTLSMRKPDRKLLEQESSGWQPEDDIVWV